MSQSIGSNRLFSVEPVRAEGYFVYFGYGANMCSEALQAKGIRPYSSEPAALCGYRLSCGVKLFAPFTGGVATISRVPEATVHGVLHILPGSAAPILDEIEGVGFLYERAEVDVTTYSGRALRAQVYNGLPERLDHTLRCTPRYRNILLRGMREQGLCPDYIEEFERQPVLRSEQLHKLSFFSEGTPLLTGEVLSRDENHLVVAGAAFELRPGSDFSRYLRSSWRGGVDFTKALLRLMEQPEPVECAGELPQWSELTVRQRNFLNPFLHSLGQENHFLGRLKSNRYLT